MRPKSGFWISPNLSELGKITLMSQFSDMTLSLNFLDDALFFLSSLVTGSSFMSLSFLFLEFWQFLLIKDWTEIKKLEIPPSEFGPISGDWGELGIPTLTRTSLLKCYWMLQNVRVTVFTVSDLLRENQQGREWEVKIPHPPRLWLKPME